MNPGADLQGNEARLAVVFDGQVSDIEELAWEVLDSLVGAVTVTVTTARGRECWRRRTDGDNGPWREKLD